MEITEEVEAIINQNRNSSLENLQDPKYWNDVKLHFGLQEEEYEKYKERVKNWCYPPL